MNYYNPYFNSYPYMAASTAPRVGLLGKLFGNGVNFSSILSGTQKTLGIVNQTIPLVKQATPIVKNAKTMFKVMNEFKRVDTPVKNKTNTNKQVNNNVKDDVNNYIKETKINEGPTFFL